MKVQHCHISPFKIGFITQDDTESLCGRKRPSQVTCLTHGLSEARALTAPGLHPDSSMLEEAEWGYQKRYLAASSTIN